MKHGRKVYVIGGGGHAKVVIRALQALQYTIHSVLDDDEARWGQKLLGIVIDGPIDKIVDAGCRLPAVIAIGKNETRKSIADRLRLDWLTVIDPRAIVDPSVVIGRGSVVLPGAIIQLDSRLGDFVIVNTAASVDHDCAIGSFTHLGPGVHLAGGVRTGDGVFMGIGASAIPGVAIGDWSTVGAGGCVVSHITSHVIAKGVPARTEESLAARLRPGVERNETTASHALSSSNATLRSGSVCVASPPRRPLNTTHSRSDRKRVHLSPPHMSPRERELLLDAFDSNWIAPLGPHVDALEQEFAAKIGAADAAAVSSGTAALHLALVLLGVGVGDEVLTSSLTFAATANAIAYCGAHPVFIDSDQATWNMDPNLLADELATCARRGQRPKAVLAVDLYGQCANFDSIVECCSRFDIPLIEDAAEALGASYHGKSAGLFGTVGCFSFNGNKIITASAGGMLVTASPGDLCSRARFLASQARDPAPHYQHSHIGYNYRMSNLLAAVARGQLTVLEDRVATRRGHFEYYRQNLVDMDGIEFMPEHPSGICNRWLTCLTVDSSRAGVDREALRLALEAENIESRPVWKPLHLQPAFANCRVRGGAVAERLFRNGLCLPSGSSLADADRERVVDTIRATIGDRAVQRASESNVSDVRRAA